MARKPCMTAVKEAGAQLVKARRMAAALVEQIITARITFERVITCVAVENILTCRPDERISCSAAI